VRADLQLVELAAGLASGWRAPARVEVDAALERFPTAVADAWLAQEGFLVDVLGPELSATVRGPLGEEARAPLAGELTSDLGRVAFACRLQDGALVSAEDAGLDATLALTPLVSERVVGNLVPLLVDVAKPEGAEPLRVAVRNLRAPLGAGVAGLSADVRLELGEVLYRALPALAAKLGGGRERTKSFAPMALQVREGVVRYDAVPISIEGEEFLFTGSFDLTSRSLDLGTELPLRYLKGDVGEFLERNRDRLDPDLAVPLRLRGTWPRPRVEIDERFLERAVGNVLQNVLQDELQRLLKKRD
jgi:hypothetical protein